MNRHKGNTVVEKERFMSAGAIQSLDRKNVTSIEGCPRNRRMLIVVSQFCLVAFTYYCSFLLRLDFSLDMANRRLFVQTLPLVLALKLPLFCLFGLMRGWWCYVGMSDLLDISKAAVLSSRLVFAFVEFVFKFSDYPRSVIPIDLLLTVLVIGGARFAVRVYTERVQHYGTGKNILVIGADRAGSEIMRQLKHHPELNYNPVGFVDDDVSKNGIKIHGFSVLGTTERLSDLIARYRVECVLIAIPAAKGKRIEQIITKCRQSKVEFKILPPFGEIIEQASISKVRKLQVEDLLNRDPVRVDLEQIESKLKSKVLLITGAGGSIGSELARQVAAFGPGKLILFDRSENELYRLETELAAKFPNLDYVPLVGDILDVASLRDVFASYRPHSVFHAAAYKHVPMMEKNCFQAVTNNVFGTYNVSLLSKQFHVEDFVFISSDKAVNPTNVMGVTKRIAELIILGLQHNHTRFIAVRFGNVLGSNGSVLPLFEQQIASGGPVTVTDPAAMRYFMTVTEAVQLVLQASTMGRGGEIFVLDMGEPIKIVDLAENVIRLSTLEAGKDIKIVFTGLRPGEKLFEELRLEGEGMKPTVHEKIWVVLGERIDFEQVRVWLEELSTQVESKNIHGLITKLRRIVPEYWPSGEIDSLREIDRFDRAAIYKSERTALASAVDDVA